MMTRTGSPPTTGDADVLRDQLNEAHAELERLRAEVAEAAGQAADALVDAAGLRDDLHAASVGREAAEEEARANRTYAEAAEARLRSAAEKYRDLVVRTEPELPDELIGGDDIDAIDASVDVAKRIVGQVRSHMEAQAKVTRVPAGAPARTAPDLGLLPPEEKIRIGLAQRTV
jgi:hypothetical protein